MGEDQDFDLSRFKEMAAVTYKIVSYPTKQGSRGVLTHDEVKLAIKLAFSKWSDVSSFNFQPVESDSADIILEFGDFYTVLNKYLSPKDASDLAQSAKSNSAIAVTANHLRSVNEVNSTPIPIVFDDAWWWTILSRENNPSPGLIGFITRTTEYAYACDLVTIAVHEIGHALGLGHNTNSSSIMQKRLGIWASTTCYYMTARPLPDVDAQDLELRYKSVDIPFDASHIGSVIVGSTFCQTNSTSDFPHYPCQDVDALCWGVRENTPTVTFMQGSGFNPALQGEGYGYLSLHLMQVNDLQGRRYVVGGGTLMPVHSGPSVVVTIPPNGLTTLNDLSGWAAPQEAKWGNETNLIQLCGRARRWNPAIHDDSDSLLYFTLSDGNDAVPRPKIQGFYTLVGDESFSTSSTYSARQWGIMNGTRNTVAQARTYPDEKKGTSSLAKYGNANSAIVIYYNIG